MGFTDHPIINSVINHFGDEVQKGFHV